MRRPQPARPGTRYRAKVQRTIDAWPLRALQLGSKRRCSGVPLELKDKFQCPLNGRAAHGLSVSAKEVTGREQIDIRVLAGPPPAPAPTPLPALPTRRPTQNQTVPTGFSSEAPSGPAIPLTAIETSAPLTRIAPAAISRTVASLTAPCSSSVRRETPTSRTLASFEYVTYPQSNQRELPAASVKTLAIHPPVHDSAVTRRYFPARAQRATRATISDSSSSVTMGMSVAPSGFL